MQIPRSWYRNWLFPRSVFIPFWLMWIVMTLLMPIRALIGRCRAKDAGPNLCVEAGIKGWESVEIKELFKSASEYIGTERVHQIKIDREKNHVDQFKEALENYSPSHYLYDPRTGDENWITGLWQAAEIAMILYWRRITPIVFFSDIALRNLRAQGCVVTAKSGAATCISAASEIHQMFPHRRLVAPNLLPLSQKTLKYLSKQNNGRRFENSSGVLFIGSLYEPRTAILQLIAKGLAKRGITLEIRGRPLGSPRLPEEDYWSSLSNAAIVVTTADQEGSENIRDWAWMPHLVGRYTETLAAGALLVAPVVPGMRRYFEPNKHFASFNSPSHAVDVIESYIKNEDERRQLAEQGRLRVEALVNARTFWMGIDITLGKDAFA